MQLHDGHLRGKRTPGTALSACTLAMAAGITVTPEKKKTEARRYVTNVLTKIPACFHQCGQRPSHRGLRDDGVPVLHIESIPARLRQLRVVVQELQEDDVEVVTHARRPSMSTRAKQKRKFGQKDRLNVIHRTKKKRNLVVKIPRNYSPSGAI